MGNLTIGELDLYYERSGEGPRLLFFGGSGSSIEAVGPWIDAYRSHFDVLVHDQRGLGRTSVPRGPYTMAAYAADAVALLDHVGWEGCRIVGTSFGGMVAQEFAVTHPQRVERLALVCTSPGGPELSSYPLHDLAMLQPEERTARWMALLDTRFNPEWLAAHPDDQAFVAMVTQGMGAPKTEDQLRGELLQLGARSHHDVVDRLGLISCPTLVACGRFDGIAPLRNGQEIAARVPGAELRVYEGGHAFFVQDPRAFPEIIEFLAA